jgi:hypothetical protein
MIVDFLVTEKISFSVSRFSVVVVPKLVDSRFSNRTFDFMFSLPHKKISTEIFEGMVS